MSIRLLVIALLTAVAAQAADRIFLTEKELMLPNYRQFTLRDGLPQMQAVCLLQDSQGYIWLGTKKGVTCYNGEKFTRFSREEGLADDFIYYLDEDYSGRIWMSTAKGLASYDGSVMTSYPDDRKPSLRMAPAKDGKIWYVGQEPDENPVFGYLENGNYISLRHQLSHNIPKNYLPDILTAEKENTVLISLGKSVYEFREGKFKLLMTARDTLVTIKSIRGRPFFADLADRNNFRLYEYVSGKLFEVARVKNGRLSGYTLLKDTIHFMCYDDTYHILTVAPDHFRVENPEGIQINHFVFDKDQRLWIGSEEGLFQLFPETFRTYRKEYLPQVWAITEDQKGNMWFASFHFPLKKYDGSSLTAYPELRNDKADRGYYFRPSIDKKGILYFPFSFGILACDGSRFRAFGKNPLYITTFYDEERDLLWAGRMSGADIYNDRGKWVRSVGKKEGLGIDRYVLAINRDHTGHFWMGGNRCIAKYSWDTREITHYNAGKGQFPEGKIVTVFNDSYRMWFGSSEGLLWYDEKNDSIARVKSPELSGAVNLISAIDTSWLVVSQPYGIYLMDLPLFNKTGEVKLFLFNNANGFMGNEPGQDGAFTDSKGNIWMTTGTEVVRMDPQKLHFNDNHLDVRIAQCNGKSLPFGEQMVILSPNDQTAILVFDAICFNRPNPVQYSWKVEGEKEDWSPWHENNYAVLNHLTGGKKVVTVRAHVPGLPVDLFPVSSITIEVNLALYKEEWFFPALFGLLALLTLMTLVLLLKTRIKMVQASRQSKLFQAQAIQSQMNPHFIFNALASLQSMILSVEMEKANDYLVKLANLIRGFLEASVSTGLSGSRKKGNGEIPLSEELEILGNYISFQQLIYPDRFEYVTEIDPLVDPARLTIPPMLLQPFVENAIRHGLLPKKGKGILNISIRQTDHKGLTIRIADDGIGIEKAGKNIQDSPFRYVSRGRELTLNRVKLMKETGYPIELQTTSTSEGTVVTIQIQNHE